VSKQVFAMHSYSI